MNNLEKTKWDTLQSQLQKTQAELEKTKDVLHMLATTVLGGVAKMSLTEGLRVLGASEGYYRMTGYTEAEFHAPPLCSHAAETVVPEDKPRIAAALERVLSGAAQVVVTYRIRQKDGKIAWNMAYCAQVEQTESGPVVDVFFRDITEDQTHSKESALNEERFRIISEQTRDVIYEWNMQTDKIAFSSVFEKMFGYPPPENATIDQLFESMTCKEDRPVIEKAILDIRGNTPYVECESRIQKADGTFLWCRNRATAIFDEEHYPVRIIGIMTDIDDYKRTTLQLMEQAEKDSLTGLLNRMTTQGQIEHHLKQFPQQLCAYLQLDIDLFKQINDYMGHAAGDKALLQISDYLTKRFGESSIIGRMGGDEFAVFLLDLPTADAAGACASELCSAVRCDFAVAEKIYPLSVSIGVSLFPKDGTTFTRLYKHADDALYQVKKRGGNHFLFFSEI